MPELKTKKEIRDYIISSILQKQENVNFIKEKTLNLTTHILTNKDWIDKTLKWLQDYQKNNNNAQVSFIKFSIFVSTHCNYR